jgi:hypothetical protein
LAGSPGQTDLVSANVIYTVTAKALVSRNRKR